jgi:hypothetical protein
MTGVALYAQTKDILGVVMVGPGEVLVLMVITAIVVFIVVRRGRVK